MSRRINVEIKARCADPARIRAELARREGRRVGVDHQVDTYFRVPHGRLKLREGTIERALIHYLRPDSAGPSTSRVLLYRPDPPGELKAVLSRALGVLTVVDKRREITFVGNVKVHVDDVSDLGSFVEIEAQGEEGVDEVEELDRQCREFMDAFGLFPADLVEASYSDLLLAQSVEGNAASPPNGEASVRRASLEDVEGILRVWRQFMEYHRRLDPLFTLSRGADELFAAYLSEGMSDEQSLVLVAEEGEAVVGYLLAREEQDPPVLVDDRCLHIRDLAVLESHRRRGIGRLLLEQASAWGRQRGLARSQLFVSAANRDGIAFWEAMGYGDDRLLLRRRLDDEGSAP